MTTVRVADLDDGPAIHNVKRAAVTTAYRHFWPAGYLDDENAWATDREHVLAWLAHLPDSTRALVAEYDETIVGYCIAGPSPEEDATERTGAIYDLFIAPTAWRSGVGRHLLIEAKAFLASGGATTATLWVFEQNERGRDFYEAVGWDFDGTRTTDGGPLDDLALLRYRCILDG